MKQIIGLLGAAALVIAMSQPSLAQIRKTSTDVSCSKCTVQCGACGMGAKCVSTCNANGNGWVKYGKKYCTNWFEGCNGGK
jgi:hypothetical protein